MFFKTSNNRPRIYKPRTFVKKSMATTLGLAFATQLRGQVQKTAEIIAEDYLRSILYTPEEVEAWLAGEAFPAFVIDPEWQGSL